MSYGEVIKLADTASARAEQARLLLEDEGLIKVAESLRFLADAVTELAKEHRRAT